MNRLHIYFSLLACSCLIALAPRSVAAQGPPALEQIRTLLTSSETKDRAWGAWWASQLRTDELTPLLQKNLSEHLSGTTWQDEAVMDSSLDALIQSGATVPFRLVESVYPRRKAQALILLAKVKPEPALDAFLLALTHEKSKDGLGLEWFVAANLLLERRVSGFAAAILEDLTVKAVALVCDQDRPCARQVFGRGGIGDGGGYITNGFPPWVTYAVQKNPGPKAVAVLQGPVGIGYSRYVSREGSRPGFFGEARMQDPPSPSTSERMYYITALAPGATNVFDENREIIWTTRRNYDTAMETFRSDLRARHLRLIERLRDAGLLTPQEFNNLITPNVNISVVDLRELKTPLQ